MQAVHRTDILSNLQSEEISLIRTFLLGPKLFREVHSTLKSHTTNTQTIQDIIIHALMYPVSSISVHTKVQVHRGGQRLKLCARHVLARLILIFTRQQSIFEVPSTWQENSPEGLAKIEHGDHKWLYLIQSVRGTHIVQDGTAFKEVDL